MKRVRYLNFHIEMNLNLSGSISSFLNMETEKGGVVQDHRVIVSKDPGVLTPYLVLFHRFFKHSFYLYQLRRQIYSRIYFFLEEQNSTIVSPHISSICLNTKKYDFKNHRSKENTFSSFLM